MDRPTTQRIAMRRTGELIYLAHPYSGATIKNTKSSILYANHLLDLGFKVFNPLSHSHYMDLVKTRDHEEWLKLDFAILDRCDGLFLCPGWESSMGCRMEWAYAIARRINIHTTRLFCNNCSGEMKGVCSTAACPIEKLSHGEQPAEKDFKWDVV